MAKSKRHNHDRRERKPGGHAVRTLRQVAAIMTARGFPMTDQAVHTTERRALAKLRKLFDPAEC